MTPGRREGALLPTVVGFLAALLVGAFVFTSSMIATLPAFRFESQFPAVLPFFLWAGATGVGHLANLGRTLLVPWRSAFGLASVVPYGVLMLATASVPGLALPWWASLAVAVCAAVPFVLVGVRSDPTLRVTPVRDADEASLRGTFLIGLATMLMAYAVSASPVAGAVVSVLLAVALAVASFMTHGLARASRTWRMRHWIALATGSLVIWAAALVRGTTEVFESPWWVLAAVLLAGGPLLLVNGTETRRA